MSDRGVSDVIGFVLVFSIVLTTMALVYSTGFASLDQTRSAERVDNAERAFDVLADNFEELGDGAAPSRSTEIKLANARLVFGDRYRTRTVVDGTIKATAAPRPLLYQADGDSQVVYEQGAIIRVEGDESVMLRQPDYLFGPNRTVIRHIEPQGDPDSIGGSATVLVRATRNDPFTAYENSSMTSPVTFELNTTEARADAWERYLDRETSGGCTASVTNATADVATVECTHETDQLYVTRTEIDVVLE